jgi:excisionase family DNA binding protein
MPVTTYPRDLIDENEAASRLGIKAQTLRVWRVYRRHLDYVKVGRSVRYRLVDIDRFVEAHLKSVDQKPSFRP